MSVRPFRAVIQPARGGGAVVALPPEVVVELDGSARIRVTGALNGRPFSSSTMPYRGTVYLGIHKTTREAAGVAVGDEVDLILTRDDRPPVLILPPELEVALDEEPALRARFEALALTRRRELADPIAEARKPDTRAARVERALARLRELD